MSFFRYFSDVSDKNEKRTCQSMFSAPCKISKNGGLTDSANIFLILTTLNNFMAGLIFTDWFLVNEQQRQVKSGLMQHQ